MFNQLIFYLDLFFSFPEIGYSGMDTRKKYRKIIFDRKSTADEFSGSSWWEISAIR